MFDFFLKSDDDLFRTFFSATIIYGGLYLLTTTGILPLKVAYLVGIIILLMVLMSRYGKNAKIF